MPPAPGAAVITPAVPAPPGPTVVTYGALTLAGAGGVPMPSGATSIASGAGYSVAGGYVVPTGTPVAAALTFNNGTVWSVAVAAGMYSVRTLAEMTAAFAAMGSVGKIISLRPGSYGLVDYPASNVNFSPRAQIIGEGSWPLATGVRFDDFICNSKNLTLSNVEIFSQNTTAPFDIGGFADGLILEDCWIHGKYHNPLLDWSTGWVGSSIGNSFGTFTSLTIRRNFISDMANAINGICDGPFTIEDNLITGFRSDGIHLGFTASAGARTGAKIIQRNVIHSPVYDSASHSDGIQFVSSGLSMTDDYSGIAIRQNEIFTSDLLSLNLDMQCLVCFRDGTLYGMRWKDPVVCGNVLANAIVHGITVSHVSGGVWANNTITRFAVGATTTGVPGLNIGDQKADGTVKVQGNVCEQITMGGGAGTATFVQARNIILGANGATIPFGTALNNPTPTVAVSSYADLLARWAIKAGGPADTVSPKAGALGSGYGVYGTPRVPAEWSFNAAFEA